MSKWRNRYMDYAFSVEPFGLVAVLNDKARIYTTDLDAAEELRRNASPIIARTSDGGMAKLYLMATDIVNEYGETQYHFTFNVECPH
jgi:hypothetical protein